jgi:hypothetical protein
MGLESGHTYRTGSTREAGVPSALVGSRVKKCPNHITLKMEAVWSLKILPSYHITIQNTVWVVMLCSVVVRYQHFGEFCCLYFQGETKTSNLTDSLLNVFNFCQKNF